MANAKIEKLSPKERSEISKSLLLRWFRSKRLEKLRAFQKEIREKLKEGKFDELNKLKEKIVENTKRELAKHKHLTQAELEKRAREFAESVISVAKGNKDINEILNKTEPDVDKEKLLEKWMENNPKGEIEVIEDSPKYVAMNELTDSYKRKEAFLMLSLIEKHWGKDEAWKQYRQCFENTKYKLWQKKGVISLTPLYEFFTRERAMGKLGFYYGTRMIVWKPELKWYESIGKFIAKVAASIVVGGAGAVESMGKGVFKVTGWWTIDENEKSENSIKGGRDFMKVLKGKLVGDEWAGFSLLKALPEIRKELSTPKGKPGYNDSGLTPAQEKARLKDLDKYEKTVRTLSKDQAKKDVYTWFKKQPHNKWIQPDNEIMGKLSYLYGKGCGKYLYRYSPDDKKIYVVRIEGADIPKEWGTAGYIKIKEGKVELWQGYSDGKDFLRAKLIENMTPEQIEKELAMHRAASGKATEADKEKLTSGIIAKLKKIPSAVEYSKLKKDYLDVVEKKIKKHFENVKKYSPEKASDLARYRIEKLEKQIKDIIKNDKALKEMIDENPDEKIKIRIDSDDEVTVKPKNRKKYKKLSKKIEKEVTGTLTSIDDAVNDAYSKLENKVGPVFAKIIDFLIGFKKGIKKIFTGKSDFFTTAVASFLGIGGIFAGKSLIGSKKVDEAFIDKLAQMGKKTKKIKYKLYFNSDVKLKDKKIIIPRGKGIKPGKKFDVKVSGKGIESADPDKKKQKKKGLFASLFSVFGGGKKEYLFKNNKIEIREGTKIPKGTIIPKGAKIVRV